MGDDHFPMGKMEHMDSTINTVVGNIGDDTTATIEYMYNQNVRTIEDGLYLLQQIQTKIDENDIPRAWLAWYFLWLVSIHYFVGNYHESTQSLNACNDLLLNDEQNKLKEKFERLFGFHRFYDNWSTFETEHFVFHYRKDEANKTDIDQFVLIREKAFVSIQSFFDSKLHRKIDFYLWDSREEAFSFLQRRLGFAIGWYYLIHSAADQSIGHEMTHIITHYVNEAKSLNYHLLKQVG